MVQQAWGVDGGGDGHVQICFQSHHNFETIFEVGIIVFLIWKWLTVQCSIMEKEVNRESESLVSSEANYKIPLRPSYST